MELYERVQNDVFTFGIKLNYFERVSYLLHKKIFHHSIILVFLGLYALLLHIIDLYYGISSRSQIHIPFIIISFILIILTFEWYFQTFITNTYKENFPEQGFGLILFTLDNYDHRLFYNGGSILLEDIQELIFFKGSIAMVKSSEIKTHLEFFSDLTQLYSNFRLRLVDEPEYLLLTYHVCKILETKFGIKQSISYPNDLRIDQFITYLPTPGILGN